MDKDLELEIKRFLAAAVADGMSLSDAQKAIQEKFEVKMTYMDVRIMASTLDGVDWNAHDPKAQEQAREAAKKKEAEEVAKKEAELEAADAAEADSKLPGGEAAPAAGAAKVEISKLVRPGAALSGSVVFPSGSAADWYIDAYGRLGLENEKGGKPSESDLQAFQQELQKQVEKMYGGR